MTVEPVNPIESADPVEPIPLVPSVAPAEPTPATPAPGDPSPAAATDGGGKDAGERTETCPSCGAAYRPQDSFCEACGTELAPAALSSGAPPPPAGRACPLCRHTQISPDGYCDNCGHKLPTGRDHQELDLGPVAGITDRGHRHHRNEDAMALASVQTRTGPVALAVVCDGVSTSDRPDEASLAAAQAAARVLLSAVRAEENLLQASVQAVRAAGDAVATLAGSSGDAPSATYVSAVLAGGSITLCWLGDSRAYWLTEAPDAKSRRLTTDDSVAEQMVLAGLLSEDEALASPQAHVVTRWIGGDTNESAPHVARFQPAEPGVLLLCSDGLWNYLPRAAELARLALPEALKYPLDAAARLVQFALDAGGSDNITAVLAPFRKNHEPAAAVPTAS